MKTRLFLSAIALAVAGWCNAADYLTLTLYADGCESANVIHCNTGQQINVTAVPDGEHRHFVRWADGNTDNPRLVTVTKDEVLKAEFAYNQYTVTTKVNDAERGSVSGGKTIEYLSTVTLTATANYGYHFTQWSDGNTDNPRTVLVEGNATYIAEFALNQYTITTTCDILQGVVTGGGLFVYGTQITVEAIPNSGYEFKQWSNGLTYNPYRFTVVSDLTLEAQFIPATAIDNTTADTDTTPQKVLIDGQVLILRNGKTYTVTGVEVK